MAKNKLNTEAPKAIKSVKKISPISKQKEQINFNKTWAAVENIYMEAAGGLAQITSAILSAVVKIRNEGNNNNATPELKIAITGLERDIKVFVEDLIAIHQTHSHRTGLITDDEDMQLSLKAVLEYNEFLQRLQVAVYIPLTVITEELLLLNTANNIVQKESNVATSVIQEDKPGEV
jgi:hypothetical protein